jgi:hypothetical protein
MISFTDFREAVIVGFPRAKIAEPLIVSLEQAGKNAGSPIRSASSLAALTHFLAPGDAVARPGELS